MIIRRNDVRMFDAQCAVDCGLAEAVFMMHISQEIGKAVELHNAGLEKGMELAVIPNYTFGAWSYDELCRELPWWDEAQIREIELRCVHKGLLKMAYYDTPPDSPVKQWYAVIYPPGGEKDGS